ncbi:MAG: hypothetical protein HKN84_04250 [Gammaproteobacteria bacterium]|nr:hypothetical protein [Gammaproteobacteria bacterium]
MAADSQTAPEPQEQGAGPVRMHGEEDTAKQSSPGKDLTSAILVAVFAVAVIAGSLQLEVPDTRFTAPGLLPFITGLALLGMSIVLAVRAVRAGALTHIGAKFSDVVRVYFGSGEERRAWLLGSLVLGYVVLVAHLSVELPLPFVAYALSAYELISILVITLILKLFWQATVLRCFLVSLFVVEALALAFRFGFNMIMPEVF